MTATPNPPCGDEEAKPAARRGNGDVATTVVLIVLAFLFAYGLNSFLILAIGYCAAPCNEAMIDVGYIPPTIGIWVLFAISGIVSIVRLRQRKRAIFIPLLGIAAMTLFATIWGAMIH